MSIAHDNFNQNPSGGDVLGAYLPDSEEQVTLPTPVDFAKHSAETEAEAIGARLNAIQVPPEERDEAYDRAFQGATHRLLNAYAVVSEDVSEFEAAYRYAETADSTLDRDRRGDLFDAYEEHPAMLAIDGLDKVLHPALKKHTPRMRRVTMLLLEAYNAEA